VLSAEDLAFWNENGYVIVRNAVPTAKAKAAEDAVWSFLDMSPADPTSWYKKPIGKGIMMELYFHDALAENRRSARIRKAFAQLWNDVDLWVTADRTSFNPPENDVYSFQGPRLHWDMSLAEPLYFGTQGILYLCDTDADQGAFTCVPGFHRELGSWLDSLPDRSHARTFNLDDRAIPIAAQAGDLIIWHQALPHGASPNRGTYPRIAHYINMFPTRRRENLNWL
jgi:ectoine hydroxylase-related dioxygenase (phytanoyl-CoA dioxygenase family)